MHRLLGTINPWTPPTPISFAKQLSKSSPTSGERVADLPKSHAAHEPGDFVFIGGWESEASGGNPFLRNHGARLSRWLANHHARLVGNGDGTFEATRRKVIEIATNLEEKDAIPAVKQQLEYLRAVQTTEFWECIDLAALEDLRTRMRGLVQFIDKSKRTIVYTNFKDEVLGVRQEEGIYMPKMTGNQYAKKVEEYLRGHQDEIAIQRLRNNQPLTPTDLQSLEKTLPKVMEA